MLLFWCFVGGFIAGGVIWSLIIINCTSGTLKIDRSDPKKDVYRLEIDKLEDLSSTKRIVLKVDKNAHISQN